MPKPQIDFILDSGAFSAFTKKQPIDIEAYATFALQNVKHLEAVVNLDVITSTDSETAAKQSFNNFTHLKNDRGLLTMPVFHSGEHIKWLDKMMEEAPFIGLSGTGGKGAADDILFYDIVWPHITDSQGYPVRHFHAFGDASPQALLGYPWYSADSTTWFVAAGLAGRILVNGKYAQFRTKTAKDENYIGINDVGLKRETWEESFRAAGLNPDYCIKAKMRESDIMLTRVFLNAVHYLEMQELTRSRVACTSPTSILIPKKYPTGGTPVSDPVKLHFVITGSTATRALAVIAQLKITNLLMSYFYVEDKQWDELIIPFLYDPIGTCKTHKRLKEQCEILSRALLEPIIL